MSRALLALLLVVGGGSPFLSSSGMAALFKMVMAADGDVGGSFDPNGGPRTNVGNSFDPDGEPRTQEGTDVGGTWDPDG